MAAAAVRSIHTKNGLGALVAEVSDELADICGVTVDEVGSLDNFYMDILDHDPKIVAGLFRDALAAR